MGFEEQLHQFEDRWQQAWDEQQVFQVDPDERDSFFITVAYPYPSGGMHVGHVGTYTLPDVFARYKRMKGYNVLFPMAWHVTGTPIIGAVERLKNREEQQMQTLQDTYNVPDEALEEMETPMGYASHFIEEYRENMQRLGYSVDWRREFTTNDERYNKFIEWQYRTLREKGLLEKGKHPTKYCLNDENPVTTHDLLEGEGVEKQEYTLVRFQLDQKILPMATLRPETVYGVTHALIHPDGNYVEARVDGETWIISSKAAEKLEHQNHDVKIERDLKGEELVGEELMNPVTGDSIMLLPATFVDTDSATGIVMSVPAHAPYDWISLKDLQENEEMLEEYGIDPQKVKDIEPISIIDVDGYGDYPAKEACEEHDITSQDDEEKLEEATDEIYKKEHHTGRLKSNCQAFAGERINDVKERLTELYENQNKFGTLWDFPAKVKCRCGGKVIVAKSETWFLRYGDAGWKDRADSCLNRVETIPDGTRDDYEHAINWLENWPCIRNYGLGTQMPFDEDFVIEPLSDSTIYMAYYTIRHKIKDIEPDKLTKEFFDYVFRGEGPVEEVAENTGVSIDRLKEVRKSFDYWYPLDWRTSANELIQTHLTFFMFHHAALFDEQHWPKGIATWGMGLLEGEKMSSSKGHVVLANRAIERYGADTVRFFMFSSCEPWQDFDWRQDEVEDYRNKLKKFYNRSLNLYGSGETREKSRIDHYVLSKIQNIIKDTGEALDDFQTRKASLKAFFELNNLIAWYRKRSDTLHAAVINEVIETQIRLLAPFIPHLCEELWDETGHEGLVTTASWPEVDDDLIDREVEYGETLLKQTIDDIKEIEDMVDEYSTIQLALAASWKRKAVRIVKERFNETGSIDISELMDRMNSHDDLRKHAESLAELVRDFKENPGDLPDRVIDSSDERDIFEEAASFLEQEFDATVEVVPEDVSDFSKAGRARPGRPAIILD